MGSYSSFLGTFNKLKDEDFEEDLYTNPPADVYSDIPGNHLTVAFKQPAVVTGIIVVTGSAEGRDQLASATVELGSPPGVLSESGLNMLFECNVVDKGYPQRRWLLTPFPPPLPGTQLNCNR
ncbi:unnamed protein product [Coregonus sp. 'balchen']|nr:unnamed protein product [Coregonus sp. 'balchen']